MSDNLDYEEFNKRIHQKYDTYQMNLQQVDDKKETALLHTNYFQDCLRDSMESTLEDVCNREHTDNKWCKTLRHTRRNKQVQIQGKQQMVQDTTTYTRSTDGMRSISLHLCEDLPFVLEPPGGIIHNEMYFLIPSP